MTRKQLLVLVVLGVVDLLVIAGLGVYARTQRRTAAVQPPPLVAAAYPSECATFLLESAELSGWGARVSETESVLFYEVSTRGPAAQVAADQAIWEILDSLSPAFAATCGEPEWVSITVIVDGNGAPQQATAQFAGDALVSWLQGGTSDSDLADQARYRSPSRPVLTGSDGRVPTP